MKLTTFASVLALSGCFMAPVAASEEPLCVSLDDLARELTEDFGESPLIGGFSENGWVMQVWVNETTGTWTTLGTNPETGFTCIFDAGEMFMKVGVKPNV